MDDVSGQSDTQCVWKSNSIDIVSDGESGLTRYLAAHMCDAGHQLDFHTRDNFQVLRKCSSEKETPKEKPTIFQRYSQCCWDEGHALQSVAVQFPMIYMHITGVFRRRKERTGSGREVMHRTN